MFGVHLFRCSALFLLFVAARRPLCPATKTIVMERRSWDNSTVESAGTRESESCGANIVFCLQFTRRCVHMNEKETRMRNRDRGKVESPTVASMKGLGLGLVVTIIFIC